MFCDENHYAKRCVKITDPHARTRFLSSNGHCFICFEKSHVASSCKQNYKCNKCNGRHHISICTFSKQMNSPQTPQNGQSQNSQSAPATPDQDSSSNNSSTNRNNILKQAATASISNLVKNSVTTDVQVIFDSGSQRTYLNEALCERLKSPVIRSERIIVETFGNDKFQARDVNVVLIKFFTGYKNVFVEEICSPVVCADLTNQNCKFVSKRYSHLQGLNLADKSTDGSKTIEILVGLDYYFEFITGEVIKSKFGEPVALKSISIYIEWTI